MSSQLRKRKQDVSLTVHTKNFLNDCPVEFTRIRKLVEDYQAKLLTVRVSVAM